MISDVNRIIIEEGSIFKRNGSKPAGEELLAKLTSDPYFAENYDSGFGGQRSLPETLVDLNYILRTLKGDRSKLNLLGDYQRGSKLGKSAIAFFWLKVSRYFKS